MSRRWPARLAALAAGVAVLAAGAARARPGEDAARFARTDLPAYVTAPAGWDARGWTRAVAAGAAVAGAYLLDDTARDRVAGRGGAGVGRFASAVQTLGDPLGLGGAAVAATYLAGWLGGRDGLRETGFRMAEAGVLTAAVTAVAKGITGRARPDADEGHASLRWFGGSITGDRSSFPSQHTGFAFSVAAVLAVRVPGSGWAGFPVAAAVGWSRLHDDEHWLSDVVAGALLGTATGLWVARRPEPGERPAVTWLPWVAPGGGVAVRGRF